MTGPAGRRRYVLAGRLYDLVSLEPLLYRRPRRRLLEMLALPPGATMVDVGCGTGLNFASTLAAIGPAGRIIGIDASSGMLAAARRRVQVAGWDNVTLVAGDARDLLDLLAQIGAGSGDVDVLLATYVLSVLADDGPTWDAMNTMAAARAVLVGIADLGDPGRAPAVLRPFYRLLTILGGGDPTRRPWEHLAKLPGYRAETYLGGHVRLDTATLDHTGR